MKVCVVPPRSCGQLGGSATTRYSGKVPRHYILKMGCRNVTFEQVCPPSAKELLGRPVRYHEEYSAALPKPQ